LTVSFYCLDLFIYLFIYLVWATFLYFFTIGFQHLGMLQVVIRNTVTMLAIRKKDAIKYIRSVQLPDVVFFFYFLDLITFLISDYFVCVERH
jgi:hypothetical protein